LSHPKQLPQDMQRRASNSAVDSSRLGNACACLLSLKAAEASSSARNHALPAPLVEPHLEHRPRPFLLAHRGLLIGRLPSAGAQGGRRPQALPGHSRGQTFATGVPSMTSWVISERRPRAKDTIAAM
jgi:hypothetical protein